MFKNKKHIITVARAVSSMEQITVQMQTSDPSEFIELVQAAEDAVQLQADRFQKQLEEADAKMAKENAVKNATPTLAAPNVNKKGK